MSVINIYAEAGDEIGMGHVVRMAILARLFKARGHHVDINTNEAGQEYFESQSLHSLDIKDKKVTMGGDIAIFGHRFPDWLLAALQTLNPGCRNA